MDDADTFLDVIARHARAREGACALPAPGRIPMTFGTLEAQIRRTGTELASAGLGGASRVALALPDGPEAAAAIVATMKADADRYAEVFRRAKGSVASESAVKK